MEKQKRTKDDYTTLAAQQAFQMYGEKNPEYADYIEEHELDLIRRGYVHAGRSLAESLMGNDGI